MSSAVMREVVGPAARVAQDVCTRTLAFTGVACRPVLREVVDTVSRGWSEYVREAPRTAGSPDSFTRHVFAAGAIAGVACAAQYMTGPVIGSVIRVTGVVAVAGLAVSAAVHAVHRNHGLQLQKPEARGLLEAVSVQVRERHAGLWAAQILTCFYHPSARTRPELYKLGMTAAVQETLHGFGVSVIEGGISGTLWNVADVLQLTLRSVSFIQDIEATALTLSMSCEQAREHAPQNAAA